MKEKFRELYFLSIWARRIGSVSAFLFLDTLIVVIIFIDVLRFINTGRKLNVLLYNFIITPRSVVLEALLAAITLIIVLPIIFTIVFILTETTKSPSLKPLNIRSNFVNILHVLLSVIISSSVFFSWRFEQTTGTNFLLSTGYAFQSYLKTISEWNKPALIWLSAGLGSLILTTILSKLKNGVFPIWVHRLGRSIRLEYLKREHYPKYIGRHSFLFNSGVWPRIEKVENIAEHVVAKYEKLGSGSPEAANDLKKQAIICCNKIKENFIEKWIHNDTIVEILPSTSRALEVALNKINPDGIIISPFEHRSEKKTAKWFVQKDVNRIKEIEFKVSDYDVDGDIQIQKIAESAVDFITKHSGRFVFILSEICFETGLKIPVDKVINKLNDKLSQVKMNDRMPHIIIDGAHTIGNIPIKLNMKNIDAYVFSGHKWLGSGEPSGILVTKINISKEFSYDSWAMSIPESTASVRMIGSLKGALLLSDELDINERKRRSDILNKIFFEQVANKLEPVGKSSGFEPTCMIAIRPASNKKWRWKNIHEMQSFLKDNKINAEIIKKDDEALWIRVAFPYFLGDAEVKQFAKILLRNIV